MGDKKRKEGQKSNKQARIHACKKTQKKERNTEKKEGRRGIGGGKRGRVALVGRSRNN